MSHESLANYLRAARRASGLSQEEVAFLIGASSGSEVSRHEHFAQVPQLPTLLAYEILYGKPVRELFRGEYETVEQALRERAQTLAQQALPPGGDPRVKQKREILGRILKWQ